MEDTAALRLGRWTVGQRSRRAFSEKRNKVQIEGPEGLHGCTAMEGAPVALRPLEQSGYTMAIHH